jgi:hypothetical protein
LLKINNNFYIVYRIKLFKKCFRTLVLTHGLVLKGIVSPKGGKTSTYIKCSYQKSSVMKEHTQFLENRANNPSWRSWRRLPKKR